VHVPVHDPTRSLIPVQTKVVNIPIPRGTVTKNQNLNTTDQMGGGTLDGRRLDQHLSRKPGRGASIASGHPLMLNLVLPKHNLGVKGLVLLGIQGDLGCEVHRRDAKNDDTGHDQDGGD
jgi:hypothetical protein